MKAVRIHQFGGPEVLRMDELPRPQAGPGEVLVEVMAASVNPVDYKIRRGGYPAVKADQLPYTLGRDVSGRVDRLGPGVTDFQPGDEIFAMLPQDRGGYVEWAAIPAELCAEKPRSLDLVQAASVPLAALTAWQGLFDHGRLVAGQRVLIHGASGGVGHFAVQFAKARGAEVFATASGQEQDFLKRLGADRAIDYKGERFEDAARDIDLVFDLIGGETQDRSWSVLKPGGALICTVQAPDPDKAKAAGVRAEHYMAQPSGAQLREIADLIDAGKVSVEIEQVFPLTEAADAERHLERDHVAGKIVLKVGAD